jgi:hypothetical protein
MNPATSKLTKRQLAGFERDLATVMSNMQARVSGLLATLETVNGIPIKTKYNLQFAASLIPELDRVLIESGYPELVMRFQAGDNDLIKAIRASAKVPMVFTASSAGVITALQLAQNSEFAGIGVRAMEAVRQTVMNTILTGARLEDGLALIQSRLDNELQRYAWTYANTSRAQVMQTVQDLAAENYEGDVYWVYSGPLDDVTRDACVSLLEIGVFTDEEREQAEADTADERMYNCRHVFDQIPKSYYESNK